MQPVEVLEKDRQTIVRTIARIESVRPALGKKWQSGMLNYWYQRLAELTLVTSGVDFDQDDVEELGHKLRTEAA